MKTKQLGSQGLEIPLIGLGYIEMSSSAGSISEALFLSEKEKLHIR